MSKEMEDLSSNPPYSGSSVHGTFGLLGWSQLSSKITTSSSELNYLYHKKLD